MSMIQPDPLKAGDKLTLEYMNRARDVSGSGRLRVDPRTGLQLVVTSFGSFLRAVYPPSGWYLVTASLGSGQYTLVEQIEATGGTWATGLRTVSAYEANLNTAVPAASTKRVWARKRKGAWRFVYGAC